MPPDSHGGNVVPPDAHARVCIAKKCALIALDVPNAPANPEVFSAPNMNTALRQLDVSFKVQLRRLDGSTQRETIKIQSLTDFEEVSIVAKSDILRAQQLRMTFLHNLQDALRNNPRFCEELKAFLSGDKRASLVAFLKAWAGQLKKPSSEFLQLLQSN